MTNVSYLYDDAGRITQETSTGQTSVSEYDESGNRRSVIYPMGGRQLVTSFDALNRVTTIVETKPGVTGSRTTGYFYDAAGNRLLCTKPNGGSETTSYDALSRKISLTTNSGSTTVSSTIYGYDLASNVTVINEANSGVPDRVVVNDYDRAYRLTQETTVTGANDKTEVAAFTYDKANNRTARTRTTVVPGNLTTVYSDTFTYGSAANGGNSNQLMLFHDGKRFVDVSYTYDANGNRQQRLEGSSATHTYAWDSRNRLIEVTSPDGTSHYGYDYRTRRVLRDESSAGGTSDVITFSGGTSIFERVSNTTVPTVEYIRGSDWGGGIGGILYTERGGSITHNAYNSRGDVIAKTDESGTITWQASYEAFGTRTEETGTNADRQRANTKEEDPTGLLNEGFRYRDLETGLFISRDPAGFVDGPNVYTYVNQSPWSRFDPDGLAEFKIGGVYFQFFENGVMGTGRMAGPGDSHVPQLFSVNNARGRVAEVQKDPVGYARDLGKGYLNPQSPPQNDAGHIGSTFAVVEGIVTLGRNVRIPRGPTPGMATANGTVIQGNGTITATPPTLPAGPVIQNPQESKPEGESAKDRSDAQGPTEPYNRQKHYGKTPTRADRSAVGAGDGEVADHKPSLVERYYEGDPATGEPPGYTMLPGERKASAGDRSRMSPQPRRESDVQGAEKSRYSREQKKKYGL